MQYSPKLKIAMEEIKEIIKKHDIAASVVLHTPGHCELLLKLDPSYSCSFVDGDSVRIKAKLADFATVEERNQKIKDTANMFSLLSDVTSQSAINLLHVSQNLDERVGAEHGPEKNSSHTTQNN